MLAFVTASDRGEGDLILARVAQRLIADRIALDGVVQINTQLDPDQPCQMDLQRLSDGSRIRISQSLGRHAGGCSLDPAGLEHSVGQVAAALSVAPPQLLILNKFGRQEAARCGFYPVFGQALALGVPVLTCVSSQHKAAFERFADGFATALRLNEDSVMAWCMSQVGTVVRVQTDGLEGAVSRRRPDH